MAIREMKAGEGMNRMWTDDFSSPVFGNEDGAVSLLLGGDTVRLCRELVERIVAMHAHVERELAATKDAAQVG